MASNGCLFQVTSDTADGCSRRYWDPRQMNHFSVNAMHCCQTVEIVPHRGLWKNDEIVHNRSLHFVWGSLSSESQSHFLKAVPGDIAKQCGIQRNDKVMFINNMAIRNWETDEVITLIDHLITKRKDFQIGLYREDKKSSKEIWIFQLIACETGFICQVQESEGWKFNKDVVLSHDPSCAKCYLINVKYDVCVTTDGETAKLETLQDKQHSTSITTACKYIGTENDSTSAHFKRKMVVFSFKVKSLSSEVSKCLGVIGPDSVALLPSDIPMHPRTLPTKNKVDYRYFYCHSIREPEVAFESTQLERHFLAVRKSDIKGEILNLCLVHVPESENLKYDHNEVLFKVIETEVS